MPIKTVACNTYHSQLNLWQYLKKPRECISKGFYGKSVTQAVLWIKNIWLEILKCNNMLSCFRKFWQQTIETLLWKVKKYPQSSDIEQLCCTVYCQSLEIHGIKHTSMYMHTVKIPTWVGFGNKYSNEMRVVQFETSGSTYILTYGGWESSATCTCVRPHTLLPPPPPPLKE